MIIKHIGFGVWELSEENNCRPFGALRSVSKNLGDGKFCEKCLEHNFYEWLDIRVEYRRKGKYEYYCKCLKCMNRKTK